MDTRAPIDLVTQFVLLMFVLVVLVRFGIFAAAVMLAVNDVLVAVPLTLDGSALYAGAAWFTMAWLVALAWAGFWMATRSAARSRLGAPVRVE